MGAAEAALTWGSSQRALPEERETESVERAQTVDLRKQDSRRGQRHHRPTWPLAWPGHVEWGESALRRPPGVGASSGALSPGPTCTGVPTAVFSRLTPRVLPPSPPLVSLRALPSQGLLGWPFPRGPLGRTRSNSDWGGFPRPSPGKRESMVCSFLSENSLVMS